MTELQEAILLLGQEKRGVAEIATLLVCSRRYVRTTLSDHGLYRPQRRSRPRWGQGEIDLLRTLYIDKRLSIREIANTGVFPNRSETSLYGAASYHVARSRDERAEIARARIVGKKTITSEGYVLTHIPRDDPYICMAYGGGTILEHRYVMAQTLGRPLVRSEVVHHRDHNRTNNAPANLSLVTIQENTAEAALHSQIVRERDARIAHLESLLSTQSSHTPLNERSRAWQSFRSLLISRTSRQKRWGI